VPFPTVLSSFVGREREVRLLVDLLTRGDVRLLTLTGPGGVGKTRLALRVAEAVTAAFDDAIFVPLAPIRDPELVFPTIAHGLGIRDSPDRPLAARIAAELRDRRLLLVLDNLEQLLPAAALVVARLLAACAGLVVLATSREALRLSGERVVAVAPLATPRVTRRASTTDVMATDAVRLFVARAEAVRTGFALTDGDAEAVAEIVRRLDGVPLAIELAAARVDHLPPVALLRRLERRLPLLTGSARDLPERQRTVRDTIAWSHDLLSAAEQALFRRLAVFAGGCTLEAAESVVNAPGCPGVEALDGIASVVAKNLLRQETDAQGEPRYLMLETAREFALDQLARSGEAGPVALAHAAWALAFAERVGRRMSKREDEATMVCLDAESANLREALEWFAHERDGDALVRLVAALHGWWSDRADHHEGRAWAERALASAPQEPSPALGWALLAAAHLAHTLGDDESVDGRLERVVSLGRALGDGPLEAVGLLVQGQMAADRGDYDAALGLLEAARVLFLRLDAHGWVSNALYHLGIVAYGRRDLDAAEARLGEALAACRDTGVPTDAAYCLEYLGLIACDRGDLPVAAERLAACTELGALRVLAHHRGRLVAAVAVLAAAALPDASARLFGAAEAVHGGAGLSPDLPERAVYARACDRLRAALGAEAFERARQQGRLMPDEAVDADLRAVFAAACETGLPHPLAATGGLSARQVEVLRLVADGLTDAEVAARLSISPRTVGQHLHSVYNKLGVPSRAAATRFAVEHKLV
jgi:predicted ATPase/DNA-binding CsgD family transcriptional regulator